MNKASSVSVPGVFWAILIVTLVPALVPVIEQVFPGADYKWSAALVVVLVSIAKTVEIVYRRQIAAAKGEAGETPQPASLAQGGPADGDDYTYTFHAAGDYTVQPQPKPAFAAWLFG